MSTPEQYRRKLPHIQPKDAVLFITFRLKGTLPKQLMLTLNEQLEQDKAINITHKTKQKEALDDYYEAIEQTFDLAKYGPDWLKQDKAAQLVADSLHYLDEKELKLICYCIMSNHVHFIAYQFKQPVHKIMNSLKTYTAREINKVLNRSETFWQREYYDRMIRDRNDLSQKIEYVINNPVKAGLVDTWEKWKWSYCRPGFL